MDIKQVLLIILLVSCLSCGEDKKTSQAFEQLSPEGKEYVQKKMEARPGTGRGRLKSYIYRNDLKEFASKRIRVRGGFKYRLRPSRVPEWKYLLVCGQGMDIVDVSKGTVIKSYERGGGPAADFVPGEFKTITFGSLFTITDLETGNILKKWYPSAGKDWGEFRNTVRFLPDNRRIVASYSDDTEENPKSTLEVWDLSGNKPKLEWKKVRPERSVVARDIVFSPDGQYFVFSQQPQPDKNGTRTINLLSCKTLKPEMKIETAETRRIHARFHNFLGTPALWLRGRDSKQMEIIPYQENNINGGNRWVFDGLESTAIMNFDVRGKNGTYTLLECWSSGIVLSELTYNKQTETFSQKYLCTIAPGNGVAAAMYGPDKEEVYLQTRSGDLWLFPVEKLKRYGARFKNIKEYYIWKAKQKFGEGQQESDDEQQESGDERKEHDHEQEHEHQD